MLKIIKYKKIFFSSLLLLTSQFCYSGSINEEIVKTLSDQSQLAAGKNLFNSACSGCHKKDLSGAMGFNLKDGEWIHGNSPSEIYKNISDGFAKAGMPAFSALYSEEQLKQITAYVISKREGWDNLSYKIFQLPENNKRSLDELKYLKPVKTGNSNKNIADFSMPETKEFGIIFEGDFYTYDNKDTLLYALGANPSLLIKLEIDGKEVKAQGDWARSWPLKRGKQQIKLTLVTPQIPWPKWTRSNVELYVTNPEKTRKYFPVSTKAKTALNGTNVEIKAETTALVQRKKVVDLPPYTISVGLSEKMNYGFNTRSCSVNGVWTDNLLNIGPNIKGRGKDGSLILGEWAFKAPQELAIQSKKQNCKFIKYTREHNPKLQYIVDGVTFELQAKSTQKNELTFVYTVLKNASNIKSMRLNLPINKNAEITSKDGTIENNMLTVDVSNKAHFSIQVVAKGEK